MGAWRAFRHRRRIGEDGVTPVIGTIMILGITVMGIAAVMLWGGPALQRVQEQGAQAGMLGEFQEIRRDSLVLSITDASRVPRINVESGIFGLREGTRIQITAMYDAASPLCDFHVTDWGVGANDDRIEFTAADCAGTVNVYRVTGTNLVERSTGTALGAGIIQVAGSDFTTDDWMFEIENGGEPVAQAWLMSTNAVHWELRGASHLALRLEGGALFSSRDGTHFLEGQPPIEESAAGNDHDFVVEWHTYRGSLGDFSGRGTPSLFLSLIGNNLRLSEDQVFRLRFDFEGDYGQAWCNTLLSRNGASMAGLYSDGPVDSCDTVGSDRYSLVYAPQSSPAGSTCPANCVSFEFIHARITASL